MDESDKSENSDEEVQRLRDRLADLEGTSSSGHGQSAPPADQVVRTEKYIRGPIGRLTRWAFIAFNFFMVLWVGHALSTFGHVYNNASSTAEQAGTEIGITIGLSVILGVWVAGDIILGFLVLLTRGQKTIVEQTTSVRSAVSSSGHTALGVAPNGGSEGVSLAEKLRGKITPLTIGLGVLTLLVIIGGISALNNHPSGSNSAASANSDESANTVTDLVTSRRPADETAFMDAVAAGKIAFANAGNDLAKGGTRGQRKQAICNALKGITVMDWTGRIAALGSNSEGKGILTIDLGDGTKLSTWNNALSDIGSDTLIESSTALFNSLSGLSKGDAVKFSGTFFSDDIDCVRELSFISLEGSMTQPDFLMRYSQVFRLTDVASAPPSDQAAAASAEAPIPPTPTPAQSPVPQPVTVPQPQKVVANSAPSSTGTTQSATTSRNGGNAPSGTGIVCFGTGSNVASMVCGEPSLKSQDTQIASIYRTLVARADPDQRAHDIQEQKDWIADRNDCDSIGCLRAIYQQRLGAVTSEAWTQYNGQQTQSSDR